MVTTGVRRVGQPAPLRLTRRGQVVVLAFFVLLASLASAVLWTTASRADQPPAARATADQPPTADQSAADHSAAGQASAGQSAAGQAPTVVVRSDDTLWSIAARISPGRNPYEVIAEIYRLNDMRDSTVYAGDTLVVPRAG